ncbi:hypothetical protein F5X68DRAFT_214034 [Plectosphaerella plurivora]|uniref:Uncharacterized protein n=1 Tax=Plectosphaerella plurivora TaxID=936078 RepID=A0A9P8V4S4_9PEZI|nr:hypothetical protein F5X68DRAFT_214034 [Plectosphaerella plurivora]
MHLPGGAGVLFSPPDERFIPTTQSPSHDTARTCPGKYLFPSIAPSLLPTQSNSLCLYPSLVDSRSSRRSSSRSSSDSISTSFCFCLYTLPLCLLHLQVRLPSLHPPLRVNRLSLVTIATANLRPALRPLRIVSPPRSVACITNRIPPPPSPTLSIICLSPCPATTIRIAVASSPPEHHVPMGHSSPTSSFPIPETLRSCSTPSSPCPLPMPAPIQAPG